MDSSVRVSLGQTIIEVGCVVLKAFSDRAATVRLRRKSLSPLLSSIQFLSLDLRLTEGCGRIRCQEFPCCLVLSVVHLDGLSFIMNPQWHILFLTSRFSAQTDLLMS